MKIGRTEKIWLASVLFFWVFYNFPPPPPPPPPFGRFRLSTKGRKR